MYKWEKAVITKKGMALMAKLTKGKTLYFTRAVSGAGYVEPDRLQYQTGVTDEKNYMSFGLKVYPEEGKCALITRLYNTMREVGYKATQIGIYAMDPDDGVILFMIAQAASGDGTDVPSKTDMPGYSAEWTFYIQYDHADEVTVVAGDESAITEEKVKAMIAENAAPAYTYGTEDLTAGTSPLETGKLYFVYE